MTTALEQRRAARPPTDHERTLARKIRIRLMALGPTIANLDEELAHALAGYRDQLLGPIERVCELEQDKYLADEIRDVIAATRDRYVKDPAPVQLVKQYRRRKAYP